MKNAFEKALNATEKKKKIYRYKHFETRHFALVPLMYVVAGIETIKKRKEAKEKFSIKRVNKMLTKKLLKHGEINKEEKTISYTFRKYPWRGISDFGFFWNDKKYYYRHKQEINEYFIDSFEIKDCSKKIEDLGDDWICVIFTKI